MDSGISIKQGFAIFLFGLPGVPLVSYSISRSETLPRNWSQRLDVGICESGGGTANTKVSTIYSWFIYKCDDF